ncbi:MAG: hypothetical protein IKB84_04220 [Clostridia bacterium]|nr:hypothetical protein [Clostridia bacterium]
MSDKKNTLALLGEDAPQEIADALRALGFSVLRLPCDSRLATPVRSHADMLMLPVGKVVFTSSEYLSVAEDIFKALESLGYEIVSCNAEIRSDYPHDVAFDALVLKSAIVARLDSLPDEIKTYAAAMEISLLDSKQGYAKCSAVSVGESAIITADKNIARAAEAADADTLLISAAPEAIRLDGYDYGFIGGASGVLEDTVYFTGDISSHPDAERITEFCKAHGKKIISLSSEPLNDVGGIFFFQRIK